MSEENNHTSIAIEASGHEHFDAGDPDVDRSSAGVDASQDAMGTEVKPLDVPSSNCGPSQEDLDLINTTTDTTVSISGVLDAVDSQNSMLSKQETVGDSAISLSPNNEASNNSVKEFQTEESERTEEIDDRGDQTECGNVDEPMENPLEPMQDMPEGDPIIQIPITEKGVNESEGNKNAGNIVEDDKPENETYKDEQEIEVNPEEEEILKENSKERNEGINENNEKSQKTEQVQENEDMFSNEVKESNENTKRQNEDCERVTETEAMEEGDEDHIEETEEEIDEPIESMDVAEENGELKAEEPEETGYVDEAEGLEASAEDEGMDGINEHLKGEYETSNVADGNAEVCEEQRTGKESLDVMAEQENTDEMVEKETILEAEEEEHADEMEEQEDMPLDEVNKPQQVDIDEADEPEQEDVPLDEVNTLEQVDIDETGEPEEVDEMNEQDDIPLDEVNKPEQVVIEEAGEQRHTDGMDEHTNGNLVTEQECTDEVGEKELLNEVVEKEHLDEVGEKEPDEMDEKEPDEVGEKELLGEMGENELLNEVDEKEHLDEVGEKEPDEMDEKEHSGEVDEKVLLNKVGGKKLGKVCVNQHVDETGNIDEVENLYEDIENHNKSEDTEHEEGKEHTDGNGAVGKFEGNEAGETENVDTGTGDIKVIDKTAEIEEVDEIAEIEQVQESVENENEIFEENIEGMEESENVGNVAEEEDESDKFDPLIRNEAVVESEIVSKNDLSADKPKMESSILEKCEDTKHAEDSEISKVDILPMADDEDSSIIAEQASTITTENVESVSDQECEYDKQTEQMKMDSVPQSKLLNEPSKEIVKEHQEVKINLNEENMNNKAPEVSSTCDNKQKTFEGACESRSDVLVTNEVSSKGVISQKDPVFNQKEESFSCGNDKKDKRKGASPCQEEKMQVEEENQVASVPLVQGSFSCGNDKEDKSKEASPYQEEDMQVDEENPLASIPPIEESSILDESIQQEDSMAVDDTASQPVGLVDYPSDSEEIQEKEPGSTEEKTEAQTLVHAPCFEEDAQSSWSIDAAKNSPVKMKDVTSTVDEDSRASSFSQKSATKRPHSDEEILPPVFTAEQLFEYRWPTDGGDFYLIQEHVSEYLGVKSFKRKYPDLVRRFVEVGEKRFLKEKAVVSETLCDLGLTAIRSDDVLELMSKDYPLKYQEYIRVLQERERQKINSKHKEYSTPSIDKAKMNDFVMKAIKGTAEFNMHLNQERREERRTSFDMQSYTIHIPANKIRKLSKDDTKVGKYPIALLPGQFQDYYHPYSSQELKYFPINSVLYGPLKELPSLYAQPGSDGSQSDSDDSCASDGSSCSSSPGTQDSGDSSSGSESAPPPPPHKTEASEAHIPSLKVKDKLNSACKVCHGTNERNKDGFPEELIHCAECGSSGHPTCLDVTSEMVEVIRTYAWQCMDCKTCMLCMDPYDEDKMMFCDKCDRGYHTFCVGLKTLPNGRWICQSCGQCSGCGARAPGPEGSKAQWQQDCSKSNPEKKPHLLCLTCAKPNKH